MKKLVQPSVIKGTVVAPASKSMMQRSIAVAILANGKSLLRNYTPCDDSDAALKIAGDLGCNVSVDGTTVIIDGELNPKSSTLNCGEAGLGIRMFTPIASLCNQDITLEGEGSLKKRPVSMLEKPLSDLGVSIKTNGGFIPITVSGPMKGGEAEVDGSVSSQMLTGMLLALPCAENDSVLHVKELKSKPYIDMTLEVMRDFGVEATHDNYEKFYVRGRQEYHSVDYNVEGDWSGASFLLVAGAVGGKVKVENLNIESLQADVAILRAIEAAGAIVRKTDNAVVVEKSKLRGFQFDATECPDLFPPLVSLACHCQGDTTIKGVGRLKHKESDRATVLKTEFAKIGVTIDIDEDTMIVYGGSVKGGTMHANNDHRIAMAAAVAAILSENEIEIENAECIAKSYPGFYDDFKLIGGEVSSL